MADKKVVDMDFLERNLKNFGGYLVDDNVSKTNETKTTWSTSKIKDEINNGKDLIVVDNHSNLLSIIPSSNKIAYQVNDETISTELFEKGFYIYSLSISSWEYIGSGTGSDGIDFATSSDNIDFSSWT